MNPIKHLLQHLVLNFAALSLFASLFAQELSSSHIQLLTPERMIGQPSLNGELLRQLHWSNDSARLGFLRSFPSPSVSPSKDSRQLSTEIWSIDPATGHRAALVSSSQLETVLKAIKPVQRSGDDDDHPSGPPQLSDFAWAPGDRALLLITPISLAWIDLNIGRARSLVAGGDDLSDAKLSPDGRYVTFIRDHALWLTSTATGATHRLTPAGFEDFREAEADWPYHNELGLRTAYWWSPDSSQIAYLETDDRATGKYTLRSADGHESTIAYPLPGSRLPVVRVFVQAVKGGPRRAVDLASAKAGYVPRLCWTPDSRHLAVQHLARSQKALDLLLVDAATGQARVVLSDKDSYWINLSGDARFLRDSRRFVWSSERSGYRHLYLYNVDGHQLAQLTHGDWEVTSLDGIDEGVGQIYFTATQESPLQRQVYRVGIDGSGLTATTQEKGTHEALFSPDAHLFVDTYSNAYVPPRQDVLRGDGTKVARINDDPVPELATYKLPPVEFLTVKTHMGADLNALMIRPPEFDETRKYPLIVYVAGGPGEQVVRDVWGGDTFLWLRMMAQKGYVVYAQDSHGSAGRGHLFEEPLHLRFSSQEMADQRDGVHYLRSLPYVDPARVGIYGWGYGGFLALHGMLDLPIAYKAGIAGAPITDWQLYDAVFAERYLEDPVRNQDGYLASSPTENGKNLKGQLLVVQGMMDEQVHVENSLTLLNEFLETAKYPSVIFLPDHGHVFEDREAKLVLYRSITEFFLKNL
jgi:dipeptidyl-peptidase-4